MNMHSSMEVSAVSVSARCAHDLVIIALSIVDELDLPGPIGAHLDHVVNLLQPHAGRDPHLFVPALVS